MDKKMMTPLVVIGLVVVLAGGLLFKDKIKDKVMGKIDNKINQELVEDSREEAKEVAEEGKDSNLLMENVVELTDKGFSPATVTVKKGTKVTFVNAAASKMSVASDPHPTHTNYPEFDQWKSDFKGKTEFEFTFDKVGTWGYHDHLNPSMKGTVVVTE